MMDILTNSYWIVATIILVFLHASLKVAGESERFAVILLGRFVGRRGRVYW